jgi:hypothetical protein
MGEQQVFLWRVLSADKETGALRCEDFWSEARAEARAAHHRHNNRTGTVSKVVPSEEAHNESQ